MNTFNVGDRVRLVRGGVIGWEGRSWWEVEHLKILGEYTIQDISDDGDVLLSNSGYWHHPDHFELVVRQKEYKVRLTQSEVDALIDAVGMVHGEDYTMRRYTDRMWDTMYEDHKMHTVNPFITETRSSFRFLK